ncbi:MAG TPA: hypothetical protein VHD62_04740 [Opitutaceae bacterium]|nr:hypothetical protein [Opitutaceae bacterium]
MASPPRRPPPARWPFWLLLAAWFCANSPQPAVYAAMGWLMEARHFSHQRALTLEVARLLSAAPAETPRVARAETKPAVPPALPADAVLKKRELACVPLSRSDGPRESTVNFAVASWRCPAPRGCEPAHEPPRASGCV